MVVPRANEPFFVVTITNTAEVAVSSALLDCIGDLDHGSLKWISGPRSWRENAARVTWIVCGKGYQ